MLDHQFSACIIQVRLESGCMVPEAVHYQQLGTNSYQVLYLILQPPTAPLSPLGQTALHDDCCSRVVVV